MRGAVRAKYAVGDAILFLTAEVLVGKLAGGLKREILPLHVQATGF